ncbi:MAG TPA: hypothetical protein VJR58_22975 [Vineibacter sp.]|nr:hypothetical protein [Vineibacter sp.]
MPLTTTTIFTCDRDGVTAEATAEAAAVNPPPGWGRMFYDFRQGEGDASTQNRSGFLCPTCAEAFREFMGIESPLTKPAPPPPPPPEAIIPIEEAHR